MPRLRRLSGAELISVFPGFRLGYLDAGQSCQAAAIRWRREAALTVPTHSELDTGTLRAIVRHATAYIPESELIPHFRAS